MGTKRSCQTGHDPDIQSGPSNMGPIMWKGDLRKISFKQWNQCKMAKRHQHEADMWQNNSDKNQT
jgi:hypothetical protein